MLSQLKKRLQIGRSDDPVCDSGIYCYGSLLDTIQMAAIYPDSKTFVDKKLRYSPGKIIKKFEDLVKSNEGKKLTLEQIKEFVDTNFDAEGLELELWTPEDWTPEPKFLQKMQNSQLRGLAKRINGLWKDLSRKIKDEVKENPSLYSIIYVPNGFVVPGGRFREFYYWDTYWIVKALLHCEMSQTVKGVIENFLLMVDTYGLVPNGGRIYYTKRSQPPFLTLMMREYMNKTAENDFLRKYLPTLEKEIQFWEEKRSIFLERDGKEHRVFVFGTGGTGPRPESYKEDVEIAEAFFDSDEDKEEMYFHMKAGAETGWDYSTRWMIDDNGNATGGLKEIKTNYIIPVDLNCLMFMNYMNLAEFHSLLGDAIKSEKYLEKAEKSQEAINCIHWCNEERMWFDFDLLNNVPRKHFFPSNLFPLWAECYKPEDRMLVAESAVKYLKKTGVIYCNGGIPTSLDESGQQWDFPNAWPPLQHILVAGLLKTEHSEARQMALTIARRYTVGTMFSCPGGAEVCNMFEKYNVKTVGEAGHGGEYEVQTGFGWSNGVVIEFMDIFGDELLEDSNANHVNSSLDDPYENKNFAQSIELNTHFDTSKGMSKLIRRESNILEKEKHEFEMSEKSQMEQHPCLSIEEDHDEGQVEQQKGTSGHDNGVDMADKVDADGVNAEVVVEEKREKKVSVEIKKDQTKKLIAMFEEKKGD